MNERALLLLDNQSFNAIRSGRYNIENIAFEDAEELIKMFDEIGEVAGCYSDSGIDRFTRFCNSIPMLSFDEINFSQSAIVFTREGSSYSCKIVTKLDELDLNDYVS